MSYKIDFYETENGKSDIKEFLNTLREKASTSKDARIQLSQISAYIGMLEQNGTNLSIKIVKHIEDDIWELRPGQNRVFYFFYKDNTFVLLHHFIKKTQKTPKREIRKAKIEKEDYILQQKRKEQ